MLKLAEKTAKLLMFTIARILKKGVLKTFLSWKRLNYYSSKSWTLFSLKIMLNSEVLQGPIKKFHRNIEVHILAINHKWNVLQYTTLNLHQQVFQILRFFDIFS